MRADRAYLLVIMDADRTRLAGVLRRNRLQQKDVAEALGLSRMTVHNWVNGHSQPLGANLVRLAQYLSQFEPDLRESDLVEPAAIAAPLVGLDSPDAA